MDAEHVGFECAVEFDFLAFERLRQARNPVAQLRGALVVQRVGRNRHLVAQRLHQFGRIAAQDRQRTLDVRPIRLLVHQTDTRGVAAADLVFEARAGAIAKLRVLAVAQRDVRTEEPERPAQGARIGVGSEVERAVAADAAGRHDARECLARVDADRQERLVVAQPQVVARLQFLDEVVLEEQRFLLAARDQELDVGDVAVDEERREPIVVAPRLEVTPHPRPQRTRFSDVEQCARAAAEEIHAGIRRQEFQFLREPLVHGLRAASEYTSGATSSSFAMRYRPGECSTMPEKHEYGESSCSRNDSSTNPASSNAVNTSDNE
jgi:hypothetical protein